MTENSMSKDQYVYLGKYFHIGQKELPLDLKFGVTDNLDAREFSLSRTKSPIKYMLLRAWKLPSNVKREQVEKLISTVFSEKKYEGCEWYDISDENDSIEFQKKIKDIFDNLSTMVVDANFQFEEVNLKSKSNDDESKIESEIRIENKKQVNSKLKISIDDKVFDNNQVKNTFIETIKYVIDKLGDDFVNYESLTFIKETNDFAEFKQNQLTKYGKYFIDSHSGTKHKKYQIEKLFRLFNLNGKVELIEK